jgi:hypothetical protein
METVIVSDDDERTQLLNVDLDIVSDSSVEPLVNAFGDRVDVLHVGKWGRRYGARLEVGGSGYRDEANKLINRFVSLVESLPSARRPWNDARSREFNVGIEAAQESRLFEWRVQPRTLEGVMRVKGCIVVTVYAPVRIPYLPQRTSPVRTARRK